MKYCKLNVAALVAVMLLVNSAQAGEPGRKFLGCPVPDCIGKWCCDDYTAKSFPCVKVPLCFGCNDYCRKSMPRVCAPLCFTCDDYCKKCLPPACRPPLLSTLRCVPNRASCGCSTCSTGGCDQPMVANGRESIPRVSQRHVAMGLTPSIPAGNSGKAKPETKVGTRSEINTIRPVIVENFGR